MGFLDRLLKSAGGHHGSGGYSKHGGGHGYRRGYDDRYDYRPDNVAQSGTNPGVVCPKCSSANLPGARFCQQCGLSFVAGKCTGCGTDLAAGAKFCSQCGKQP